MVWRFLKEGLIGKTVVTLLSVEFGGELAVCSCEENTSKFVFSITTPCMVAPAY